MKNLKTLSVLVALFLVTTIISSWDDDNKNSPADVNLSQTQLPQAVQDYLTANFPDNKFSRAKKDDDSYEIHLENGTNGSIDLEFDLNGNIYKIESRTKLPNSVIPAKILTYVTANYSKSIITGWEKDSAKQDVEIDNQFDLEFSLAGDFIRVDMDGRDDVSIAEGNLPEAIKTYKTTHFSDYTFVAAVKDDDGDYEILLKGTVDNTKTVKLEFSTTFTIKKIESSSALPASTIDSKIIADLAEKKPNFYIVAWELGTTTQEVTINNHTDVVYDLQGNFIRYDN